MPPVAHVLATSSLPVRAGTTDSARSAAAIIRPAAIAATALQDEWDELAADAAEPNSFAEHWFVTASLETVGRGSELRLAEVRREGRLIGILPLAVERDYGRLTVTFLQNWCHHHLFLGTPLVRRGEERAFWTALLDALDEDPSAGHFLHLRGLSEEGPVHRALLDVAREGRRTCSVVHREMRALLEGETEARAYYERHVRPKKRKEIRRLQSRLSELGEVRATRFDGSGALSRWCDEFLALEKAGWKGRAGTALACAEPTDAFFRRVVEGAWRRGRLDFLRLDLDGRPIAMLVSFLAAPGSFSFKTAFAEDFARFSPGVLVQIENLKIMERGDIAWMDSCAIENHPMIDSLWSGRRSIVRTSVALRGLRRTAIFLACRTLESGSVALRAYLKRSNR